MMRFMLVLTTLALLAGCNSTDQDAVADANRAGSMPAGHSANDGHDHGAAPAGSGGIVGEVLETMNSGGYTYVLVKTADGDVWAAGPETTIAVGDQVDLGQGMLMPNFRSETLDRTFEAIYFVGAVQTADAAAAEAVQGAMNQAHAGVPSTETSVTAGDVNKADGGQTIAELHGMGASAGGTAVLVRGKVVKVNMNIMGTNWYHIQDGSAEGGQGDLTVTSEARLNMGDTVLVRGTATVDKDFGAGYRYDLIVENAQVTVESM